LIVADGFSCKSQIEQAGTGRRALHVAEVIELAREREALGPYPERTLEQPQRTTTRSLARSAVALGAAAAVAGAALAYTRTS
jgi:hypothetical protein